MKRYSLIAGSTFRMYTGTVTFTGLRVVAHADTADEMKELTHQHYESGSGLLLWIDTTTGLEVVDE